jgi:hypothetical protein
LDVAAHYANSASLVAFSDLTVTRAASDSAAFALAKRVSGKKCVMERLCQESRLFLLERVLKHSAEDGKGWCRTLRYIVRNCASDEQAIFMMLRRELNSLCQRSLEWDDAATHRAQVLLANCATPDQIDVVLSTETGRLISLGADQTVSAASIRILGIVSTCLAAKKGKENDVSTVVAIADWIQKARKEEEARMIYNG